MRKKTIKIIFWHCFSCYWISRPWINWFPACRVLCPVLGSVNVRELFPLSFNAFLNFLQHMKVTQSVLKSCKQYICVLLDIRLLFTYRQMSCKAFLKGSCNYLPCICDAKCGWYFFLQAAVSGFETPLVYW